MIFAIILPNAVARKPRLWLSIIGSLLFSSAAPPSWTWAVGSTRKIPRKKQPPSPFSAAACLPVRLEAAPALQPGLCSAKSGFRIPSNPAPRSKSIQSLRRLKNSTTACCSSIRASPTAPSTFSRRPVVNTADEMRTFGQALRKENLHRIILVTSRVHTRRTARPLGSVSLRKTGEAIVRGAHGDGYDPMLLVAETPAMPWMLCAKFWAC